MSKLILLNLSAPAPTPQPEPQPKPKLRTDALEKAMHGTLLSGDAGMWLEDGQANERDRIMKAVDAFENISTACGFNDFSGEYYIDGHEPSEYIEAQRHTAYDLFKLGYDITSVAAAIHRPIAWCEALRQEFNL